MTSNREEPPANHKAVNKVHNSVNEMRDELREKRGFRYDIRPRLFLLTEKRMAVLVG
jgi:hypothetical protein